MGRKLSGFVFPLARRRGFSVAAATSQCSIFIGMSQFRLPDYFYNGGKPPLSWKVSEGGAWSVATTPLFSLKVCETWGVVKCRGSETRLPELGSQLCLLLWTLGKIFHLCFVFPPCEIGDTLPHRGVMPTK